MSREQLASDTASDEGVCLTQTLNISFGSSARDNRPTARVVTFGELVQEFSTPDTSRGTLSSAQYHALDKSVRDQKAQRDQEKDGAYFVPCHFGGDGRRCNDNVEELCGFAPRFRHRQDHQGRHPSAAQRVHLPCLYQLQPPGWPREVAGLPPISRTDSQGAARQCISVVPRPLSRRC